MKVYKAGKNSIITLELLLESKTNEGRDDVVDPNFAKFRTNKAKVISIVNPQTNDTMDKDCSDYDRSFKYTVGQVVDESEYDDNINKICAAGIHYFKTYEAALSYYWGLFMWHTDVLPDGAYIFYHDNGKEECRLSYANEMLEGEYVMWYKDGTKSLKYNYKNNKFHGKCTEWHANGSKIQEYNFENGDMKGEQKLWKSNGTLIRSWVV